jgi:hypothetical protein
MHIPPVHNRCALNFVIGDISGKYTFRGPIRKPGGPASVAGAEFETPLYTKRTGNRPRRKPL